MTATTNPTQVAHPVGYPWPVHEAAAALSVTERFLRTLLSEGSVRCIRLGRRVLVPDDEMRRLMKEGIVRAA